MGLRIEQPRAIHLRIAAWGLLLFEAGVYYVALICIAAGPVLQKDDWAALLAIGLGTLVYAVAVTYLRRKLLRVHFR